MPNLAAAVVEGLGHTLGALLALALAWSVFTLARGEPVWLPPPCVFGVVGYCREVPVDV